MKCLPYFYHRKYVKLGKFNLQEKGIQFYAEKTNINFGSKLKAREMHSKPDIEFFVFNVYKHFHIYTTRIAQLKEHCDFVYLE